MATNWYWANIAKHAGQFWVTMPDFLGVNVAADTQEEALQLTADFASDHLQHAIENGQPVPVPTKADDIEAVADECGRAMIPVDVPGKSIKISMTIDEALLKRVDQAATSLGETRSGFMSTACVDRLKSMLPRPVTEDDVRRYLDTVDWSKIDLSSTIRDALRK